MPLLILSAIVQIALIVHVFRTGRPMYWAFIIFIAPGIGSIAYFIVEILPGLSQSRQARSALRGVKKTLDPGADIRRREKELRLSGSVDANRRLAEELIESGQFEKAIEHYKQALTGLYEHDPDMLLGLATAEFESGDASASRDTLDRLKEHNPEYRSSEGHLLYARAVDACGDTEQAREEFDAVVKYYAGAEARIRYGQFLEHLGDASAATEQYNEVLDAAELAPRHYRAAQKKWIAEAKSGVSRLSD